MMRVKGLLAVLLPAALGMTPITAGADAASSDQFALSSVKIGVSDFKRSMDFYTKYFGMIVGPQYIPAEQQLSWGGPATGPGVILVHDETGKLKLPPGGGWLVFRVPNVKELSAKFKADGISDFEEFSSKISPTEEIQVILIKDPDANQLELLQMSKTLSK